MTKKFNFKFTVKNRKIENSESLRKFIGEYVPKLEDGKYIGEIKEYRKQRSQNQNKFFHGPFLEDLANKLGVSVEIAKKEAKFECLSSTFIGSDGKMRYHIPSTADLTTIEFENFIDKIREWHLANHREELIYPNQTEFDY